MAISVVMPALEMAQETGKLLAWRKKEGDPVSKGEPLLEIETDKVVVELEAPGDGVLAGISAGEGAVIPVGQTIAWIVKPGEQPPVETDGAARAMAAQARPQSAGAPPASTTAAPAPAVARPSEGGPRVSPKARRIAQEHGVDLSKVRGTGPGGTISAEDVLAAAKEQAGAAAPAAAAAPSSMPAEAGPLSAIARLMAERTAQSWTTVPHFFLVRDVDAGALIEAREQLAPAIESARGVKLTQTDLLIALVARVLAKHPKMNASWTGDSVRFNPQVNISLAIAVNDGVTTAVIPNTASANLAEIALQRRDLAERAKSGKLRPSDITGGTFTISNLGMFGVDAFSAIITPPQAAILAVGRIADRVVPVGKAIGIRPMLTMTLSSDHRVVDGAQAAVFLNDLAGAVQEANKWLG
jgi:pyruvate dehydrogenase E2 component (dihydrolipoamide acetyltransferase)